MSSFDEPGANHRNALAQVDNARQRALTAVSEVRKAPPPEHHPNLAPTQGNERTLAVACTQAVVDYLLQLRPYRASSSTWDIDFGVVELPKTLEPSGSGVFGERESDALRICRDPRFQLKNVSQLIEAANTTVHYSTNYPRDEHANVANRKIPQPARTDGGEDGFTPAVPSTNGGARRGLGVDGRVDSYKLVFPASTLLRIVELADEVAAELNLLAELKPPNKEDAEGF